MAIRHGDVDVPVPTWVRVLGRVLCSQLRAGKKRDHEQEREQQAESDIAPSQRDTEAIGAVAGLRPAAAPPAAAHLPDAAGRARPRMTSRSFWLSSSKATISRSSNADSVV